MKEIQGCPKYFASKDGFIYSGKYKQLRRLKGHTNRQGYLRVQLCINEKPKNFSVARLVAKAFLPDFDNNLQVDHINGIIPDNRVENLRVVSVGQNLRGFRKKSKNCSSKYRGVCWFKLKNGGKWNAQIWFQRKRFHLGLFNDEIEAAKAYDEKAIKLGYAKEALNFSKNSLTE